jgi:hypothetical protein
MANEAQSGLARAVRPGRQLVGIKDSDAFGVFYITTTISGNLIGFRGAQNSENIPHSVLALLDSRRDVRGELLRMDTGNRRD